MMFMILCLHVREVAIVALILKRYNDHCSNCLPVQAFTDHYYAVFSRNRQELSGLYQDQSMLTFEGQQFVGPQQVGCVLQWFD